MSVQIDPTARVSPLADIEASVRGTRIVIGPECMVDAFVKIKPVGGTGDVVLGRNCYLNSGCVVYSGNGVSFGNDVLVAANCVFAAANHAFDRTDVAIRLQGFQPSRGGIRIGNDVWIGAGVVLLDGAEIGDGTVVAAGSVVTGRLPPMTVCAGTPAKVLKPRGDG